RNGSSQENHARCEERLRTQLSQACRKVWFEGFQKEAHGIPAMRRMFKILNILLAGGGFRRDGLRAVTNSSFPVLPEYPERWEFVSHRPTGLTLVGHPTGFVLDGSWQYLAVAHGLSREKGAWPKIQFPEQLRPERREPKVEDIPVSRG